MSMRRTRWLLAAALGILAVLGVAFWLITRDRPYDLDEVEPKRQLKTVEARLRDAVSASEHLSLATLGEVRYEGFVAPLWRVAFTPPEPPKHRVLLTGGVHGNEPAGAENMLRFIESLAKEPERYATVAFDIIPLVNPCGWTHDRRRNRDGRDINRDFASFKAQEARIIRGFVQDRAYDMVVDHHEDSSANGFYLYQIANGDTALCRSVIEEQRGMGHPIEQNVWMAFLKTKDGIIYAPRWSLSLARGLRQLSLANYLRITKCTRAFLIESPSSLKWGTRLKMQDTALRALLAGLET